ncbi:GntR family transcriptional regulator [Limosilactobacillus ingluviei]|uniref:HTH gntR-type domain-containing protein n=1 Tax=Limosilactobacillus ingluviei TaxID=148604 RepID=A0A0R2GSH8_9LACO|nr:GntR family transcriptional regulator [Limosilactobacillus ingluviei]KRN43826.1 hypothetical protein IV41_GL001237 [Limosilactobacillus ingluviei]MBM6728998.1 GntR family transcriptional regulator [Limosilactobacillus ingluviei]
MTSFQKPTSLRAQVVAAIQTDIFKNYEIGDKLPSEAEYANEFGVTRSTIQKALLDLKNMHLIEKVQGKGTFVTMKQPRVKLFNFHGFSDYARQIGAIPVNKVIKQEVNRIGAISFLTLVRLRSIKNANGITPLTLDESILNLNTFPKLEQFDFAEHSLYETLRENYNAHPANSTLRMSALAAEQNQATLLDCPVGHPLLQADGTVFDMDGEIVEQVKVIYSDHAEFKLTLGI